MQQHASEPGLDRTLAAAARGDAQAWRTLVEAYSRRVYALVLRQCGDGELAQEITQATFVRVVEHIGRYREQGRFEPWLFRIAVNHLRDEMRRRGRQARSVDMTGSDPDQPSPWAAMEDKIIATGGAGHEQMDPAAKVSRQEEIERLRLAVRKLSRADQEIIHLRHSAGLSFAQIAQTLEEPLGTVLARGHRALGKLRRMMLGEQADANDGNRDQRTMVQP